MTNLEIIKYLATNNHTRLAELLDDIYCSAWNCGSYAAISKNLFSENEIDDFYDGLTKRRIRTSFLRTNSQSGPRPSTIPLAPSPLSTTVFPSHFQLKTLTICGTTIMNMTTR